MIARNSAGLYPWSKDLEASSDVRLKELEGFAMLLGWLDKFVAGSGSSPGREVCERFWREQVRSKPREKWQLDQWGAAMRWYLRWLEHRKAKGGEVRSLPERVRDAVDRAGARQGKAVRTRETYGRWAAMFAVWAGDEQAVMRPDKARDFLSWQVAERRVSFATQKQGLNALVFFFKAVCGMDEVDLEVRLRKTEPRLPVVLEVKEVLAVLDKIDEKYGLMARIQYGGGLRLMELVRLRVKDVDQSFGSGIAFHQNYLPRAQTRSNDTGESYFTYRLVKFRRVGRKIRRHTIRNLSTNFDIFRESFAMVVTRRPSAGRRGERGRIFRRTVCGF